VSRSFNRFFNYGENLEDTNNFNWNNCYAQSKEDGGLIMLYWYDSDWHIRTPSSFGEIVYYKGGPTPKELVFSIITPDVLTNLNKDFTYCFELCSLHNKIVRKYKEPRLYLLSIFHEYTEFSLDEIIKEYVSSGLNWYSLLPEIHQFNSIEQVISYIKERAVGDETFEGLICRDNNNTRLKIKNPKYVSLHAMKGESDNIFLPKYLIEFILDGETDELLLYFPEVKDKLDDITQTLQEEKDILSARWEILKNEKSRKNFAAGCWDLKLKAILFKMLDSGRSLDEVWREHKDFLLKCLF
jgi:hypothetical protein